MAYTNSSLVNYKKISPNRNTRKNSTYNPSGTITKITIHHMAGNLSVETCGNVFQGRAASANYGIGSDGRVGLYVEEKDRAWTSSSPANDYKAVTIEVANNSGSPNWTVSDTAYNKLIDLCVDICKRNGISKLNYTGNANGNLTMHCFFAPTACPGPYLKSRFAEIANAVNARLNGDETTETTEPTDTEDGTVTVDGQWGVDTTSATQRYFGTVVDGIVSSQLTSCKKYLPNAHSGSWRFVSKGSGSPMIKKLQSLVGATADGLAGQDTVKKLQTYLKNRGLYTGDIDGIMGSGTVKGWQNFINDPDAYKSTTSSGSSSSSISSAIAVGDIVQFAGGSHYATAGGSKAAATGLKAGPAKVTQISANAKHPYHIVHTDSTTTVYGWVNKSTVTKKSSGSSSSGSSSTAAKKVVDEDGIWGVSTTKYTQKLMGTTQDGIVSNQRKGAKKYLPAAQTTSWQFNKLLGGGSPMIKKLQAYIGMTSKECDGLFGIGSIKQFQTFLKNKGYYTGSVDGVMGTGTAKAWQKYLNAQFA